MLILYRALHGSESETVSKILMTPRAWAGGTELVFPFVAYPLPEGVRAAVIDGRVVNRTVEQLQNHHVQACFGVPLLEGVDGHLVYGAPTGHDVYHRAVSALSDKHSSPEVTFWLADCIYPEDSYLRRLQLLREKLRGLDIEFVKLVDFRLVSGTKELMQFCGTVLEGGYEHFILRSPVSPYRFRRVLDSDEDFFFVNAADLARRS